MASVTVPAALLGAADTAAFIASRPRLFRDNPGRAWGNVGFAALWAGLAASASADNGGKRTLGLASALAAGNLALLGVHLKHGIASPRVFAGTALSGAALAGSVLSR